MKKFRALFLLFIYILSNIIGIVIANAVDCRPTWNGNWTTTENCDWPASGAKVFGDIIVQDHTITIGAGGRMGINLTTNKITFSGSNSKIIINPTAKIDNTTTSRYYVAISFTPTSGPTACPAGTYAFFQTSAPTTTVGYRIINDTPIIDGGAASKYHNINKTAGTEINSAPGTSGTLYCGAR